jgi:hypothetical protein
MSIEQKCAAVATFRVALQWRFSFVFFVLLLLLTRVRPQWPVTVSLQRLRGLPRGLLPSDDRSSFVEEHPVVLRKFRFQKSRKRFGNLITVERRPYSPGGGVDKGPICGPVSSDHTAAIQQGDTALCDRLGSCTQ